jgi:uncharacterized membrane protein
MNVLGQYPLIVPLILIVLSIPMILQKVPRNRLYGFRTTYTMSSDQVWYRANKISGIALLAAGIFWLGLGIVLPNIISSAQLAYRLVRWLGIGSLIVAIIVSACLTYKS